MIDETIETKGRFKIYRKKTILQNLIDNME